MADGSSTAVRDRIDHKGSFRAEEEDLISSLPDVILQQILCFIPTKLAISSSILSKRWRHVWCHIPFLSFNANNLKAASINKTLTRYKAPTILDFRLKTTMQKNIPNIKRWIKFAMSHNVENLSLDFWSPCSQDKFEFPDFFYINSSVKKMSITLSYSHTMISNCFVSWTSLQKLSLRSCSLSDESMAKILSGCPVLESLTLYFCDELEVLDLSKSLRLRTLQINRNLWVPGPTHIVAPHINYLRLRNSQLECTLVDVASLTEAKLDFCFVPMNPSLKATFLQAMVLKMLEKLQHADKLTFGGNFLQILSLAELRGVSFPMFKVKALTLETVIFRYVIPGIKRLLQNSPELEKLTLKARDCNSVPEGKYRDKYMELRDMNPNQCWVAEDRVVWNTWRWNVESKHVVSLVDLVLKNTNKLDKMVVLLNQRYLKFKFEELLPLLSHNKNVSIALCTETSKEDEWGESEGFIESY